MFTDRDECGEGPKCGPHGQCLNLPGNYTCDCDPGFEMSSDKYCEGQLTYPCLLISSAKQYQTLDFPPRHVNAITLEKK